MNKKISQFDLTTSLGDTDLITLVQNGQNKNITKATLEAELSDTFVADSELEDQITDLAEDLNALEKKHDDAIDEINGVVQDWTDSIANRPTYNQLQDVLNRVIISENKITQLAEAVANGEGGTSGGGSSTPGIVGPHSQSTATIFPLSGYVKDSNADPLSPSDTLNQALSKLENQIDNIASGGGEGGGLNMPLIKTGDTTNAVGNDGALYTAGAVDERYLNAGGDTATGLIKFLQGWQGGSNFRSGWDGVGASLYPVDSKWNLEVDNLFVRGNMDVNELTINEIKAVGGDILVTIADIECTEVEETSNGWRCYFDNADGTKYHGFVPLDQAICQQFDGKNVRRYWRTVLETGDNYIVLSKTSCEPGSGIPMAGDNILQLGHRYDTSMTESEMAARRNAIFISAKGSNSPRISFYANIDDFTLDGKDTTVIGTESKFVGTFAQMTSNGDIVRIPVYRGYWSSTQTYNYYDQVTHNGSLWICMENAVTSEPSATNPQWQLQVEKGEAGVSGSDTARFIEITGNRLFLYDTPDYSGTPTPESIILLVTAHGLSDSTVYTWTLLGDLPITLGTGTTLTITPTDFNTRTATIRCTAVDGSNGTYTDDFQIAKLANGAEGLDAYYIDLSNSSVSIPFDSSGNTPLINLSNVYTQVFAYQGISSTVITSISTETVSGTATATVSHNMVYLSTFTSASAIIRLYVTLEDGVTLTKDWHICRIHNGADGVDGVDAAYVVVAGEQVFKYVQGSTTDFIPTSITLAAKAYNIEYPQYKWYWAIPGSGEWVELSGQNNDTFVVDPNGTYFAGKNEVTFKCEVTSINGGAIYYDMLTINKLSDGIDGVGAYRGVLTNESHTVASTYFGDVSAEELSKAATSVQLYFQNELLSSSDFTWTVNSITDASGVYWEEDFTNNTLKLVSMPTDTAVVRVHFLINGKEVDACDFTVTKAKAGPPGDYEVSVYSAIDPNITSVSAPTFSEIPSSAGSVGPDGFNWFVDPPITSSKVIWRSVGLFDGATTMLKSGNSWTTPVIFQGTTGSPGATGRGIVSITEYYAISASSSTAPSTWYTTVQTPTSSLRYLWNREDILYSDSNTPVSGTPRIISVHGVTGDPGEDGRGISYITEYYAYGTTSGRVGSWNTTPPTLSATYPCLWNYSKIYYTDGDYDETSSIIIGYRGNDGNDGNSGPAINFRGVYSSSSTYYRTTYRADVVKYSGYYYMVHPSQTSVTNKTPSSYYVSDTSTSSTSNYWVRMTSFESVATGLLLAEKATIAGWIFDPDYNVLRSSSGHVALKGTDVAGGGLTLAIGSDDDTLGWKSNTMNTSASIKMYASGSIFLGNNFEAGISGRNDKTNGTDFRFWCNGSRNGDATFYVRHDGYLKASNAVITGDFQTISSGNRVKITNANNFQMFDSYSNNVLNLGFETNSTQGYTQPRLAMAAMTSSGSVVSSVVVNGVSLQCRDSSGTTLFSVSHNGFWGKTSSFPTQNTVVNYSSGTLYVDTSDNNRIKLKF